MRQHGGGVGDSLDAQPWVCRSKSRSISPRRRWTRSGPTDRRRWGTALPRRRSRGIPGKACPPGQSREARRARCRLAWSVLPGRRYYGHRERFQRQAVRRLPGNAPARPPVRWEESDRDVLRIEARWEGIPKRRARLTSLRGEFAPARRRAAPARRTARLAGGALQPLEADGQSNTRGLDGSMDGVYSGSVGSPRRSNSLRLRPGLDGSTREANGSSRGLKNRTREADSACPGLAGPPARGEPPHTRGGSNSPPRFTCRVPGRVRRFRDWRPGRQPPPGGSSAAKRSPRLRGSSRSHPARPETGSCTGPPRSS
jgi:hypothetical protein